ncbi:MAG TPA: hypothetical protein VK474_06340, partial [Chthoniobacterales bacterium]|nr:hypothetical protein [Chthoniobacterales bacterium]
MNSASSAAPHAWRDLEPGWRQLHGDFDRLGLSVEWHDFRAEQALDWGMSFRPRSVEFCLNVEGRGAIGTRAQNGYVSGSAGYYSVSDEPLPATRKAGERHQFVTIEFARDYLQKQLADCEADLDPQLRRAVFPKREASIVSTPRPMGSEERSVVASLLQPPVPRAAQSLWYQSKALELMAHFLFAPKDPELFCVRQKRVAKDRVERTKESLARDVANPPTLEALGQEVGCSP